MRRDRVTRTREKVGHQIVRPGKTRAPGFAINGVGTDTTLKHFLHSPALSGCAPYLTARPRAFVYPSVFRRVREDEHEEEVRPLVHASTIVPHSRDAKRVSPAVAVVTQRQRRAERLGAREDVPPTRQKNPGVLRGVWVRPPRPASVLGSDPSGLTPLGSLRALRCPHWRR
jgi:hypothetical protein